jgi:UDP-GlcNAc:undecaprenyl-phosphate GlcNAc-1-phosphate transferase
MGVPVMDTLTVMAKRMAKGRSPFVADKNHFHHQLIDMGLYHSEAVLCIYIVQAVLIVLAIIFRQANEWILLAAYFVFSVILTGLLIISAKTNFKFNRRVYLDPIKKRLRTARDRGSFIKLAFGLVKAMVPALLLFNCIVYAPLPNTYVFFSVGNFILIMIVWWLKKEFIGNVVRMSLYIITPFLVYMSDIGVAGHFDSTMVRLYNFSYLILFLSVLLTVYLTRRSTRFQSSTMDFLAVFLILLVSKLPFTGGQDYRMGLVAAKTIVLFFSYEVLLGELRLRSYKLPITATMMVLLLANARTIFG